MPLSNTQLSTPVHDLQQETLAKGTPEVMYVLDVGSTLTPQPTPTLSRSVPVLGGTVVIPVSPSTFEGRQGIVATLPSPNAK